MKDRHPDFPDGEQSETAILREALRLAAAGVAARGVENIFRELVRHLAIALDVFVIQSVKME